MSDILNLIGRKNEMFAEDIAKNELHLQKTVSEAKFLVIGGAGSIGQAVTKEIFKRNPKKLHVVDISENNMVELVRDIRSSFGYISGDFQTFALDIGSVEYDAFIKADGQFDYVLNLSALKHVRSEKDPFTLMRMIDVNILNTAKTVKQSIACGVKKYFCVSTDKAANPVNMMGASKRIMEMFLMKHSENIDISTARFANVAFSDGSLLHGFNQRLQKNQPIVAPNDVRRYFVTPQESGELCLMSCIFGDNRDIFFPKLSEALHLISFSEIAVKYLKNRGYEPHLCETEEEARTLAKTLPAKGKWPCLFQASDTTGEKDFEEFFTEAETLDLERFENLGVIKNAPDYNSKLLNEFELEISLMKDNCEWEKDNIVRLFYKMLPHFGHLETGKYLDGKM
ncbi:UDP-N-acetylglucosamine 4,6-dehydratase [Psychrosphaera sp. B3R10]|uniref:UDP-N-acetylglucosamine 4,6-dehydratase n=1 Tax=unclassified Psychrosphaera TaxID=2641570 RepID=UPI001C095A63|nr:MULTISPECIES: UDP-N-acetylglucosamine 4,6-dehydratase [unclassified Psychrosphaera]MBU2881826.1 UDP-N-acetylglucosamine 4,6-dehydratase [Psychrosphaera sp. I2R16]MBU2989202.1 UDP-N-acetylglucosamine 4,6-dehydratase [Psychrosphaera sp. B3R10]MDO6719982.1 UDP-N-acetylglucosamine 4,6-dehydratase [Psychrosphaera sp. 1_MG-2023]